MLKARPPRLPFGRAVNGLRSSLDQDHTPWGEPGVSRDRPSDAAVAAPGDDRDGVACLPAVNVGGILPDDRGADPHLESRQPTVGVADGDDRLAPGENDRHPSLPVAIFDHAHPAVITQPAPLT